MACFSGERFGYLRGAFFLTGQPPSGRVWLNRSSWVPLTRITADGGAFFPVHSRRGLGRPLGLFNLPLIGFPMSLS